MCVLVWLLALTIMHSAVYTVHDYWRIFQVHEWWEHGVTEWRHTMTCRYSLIADVWPLLAVLVVVLHAAHSDVAGLRAVAKSGQVCVVDNDEWHRERSEVLATGRRRCTPVCTRDSLGTGGGWKKVHRAFFTFSVSKGVTLQACRVIA